jgi:hypothetical protein
LVDIAANGATDLIAPNHDAPETLSADVRSPAERLRRSA